MSRNVKPGQTLAYKQAERRAAKPPLRRGKAVFGLALPDPIACGHSVAEHVRSSGGTEKSLTIAGKAVAGMVRRVMTDNGASQADTDSYIAALSRSIADRWGELLVVSMTGGGNA
ncbi:hypothetical protein GOB93_07605 [Acetobacter musti]|uniref:Uncharacterized protein n=1 Tax=Acetobacter musti TaxID=864732 RepID=A0ABX0JNA6_9PROT|nr:hypothetical protein [Acetobacter musti]NHN84509.1 hypothetical protein [Acetobacter musti]